MEIDLSKVIAYSKECLQSRAQMRSIMMDLYPGKTRDMNLLLAVYESGVPRKIRNEGKINDELYASYVKKIADDYGLKEKYIEDALDAWIDVCVGPDASKKIKKRTASTMSDFRESANKPITHVPIENYTERIRGNISDFEIKCVGPNKYEISKYIGFDKSEMIIPNEIEGKKIIGIGEDAFKKCVGIRKLVIPEGIEFICEGAFCECSSLSEVYFPSTLRELGKKSEKKFRSSLEKHGAFQSTALIEINLPNDIIEIGESTFEHCANLKKILFPDSLKVIGSSSFSFCESLEEVYLPSKVDTIQSFAFSYCRRLSKVVLNNSLRKIDYGAFGGNSSLHKIIIPQSVVEFGDRIFNDNYSNKHITIGCYPGSKAIEYARLNGIKIFDASK